MNESLSPRNHLVQRAQMLARNRRERSSGALAVLEGIRLAEEAVAAELHLEYALYSDELIERARGAALLRTLQSKRIPLHYCSPKVLSKASDTETPQGIVAVFRPISWKLEHIGPGLVVVTDQVQDPGNVGAMIRSVEAMGGAGVVVAGGVDPYNPKVIRSAMGSLFRLPVVRAERSEAVMALRAAGRRIYGADVRGTLAPWEVNLRGDIVLLVGNEGAGISPEVSQMADGLIAIPMSPRVESLNVGVVASLLMYEAMRQQRSGLAIYSAP